MFLTKSSKIGKKGLRKNHLVDSLCQKYTEPIRLNEKKINNLTALLPYIPKVNQKCYKEIGCKEAQSNSSAEENDQNIENLDEFTLSSDDEDLII